MTTKADLKERAKFEKAFEKEVLDIFPFVKFTEKESDIDFSQTMYTMDMTTEPFRTKVRGESGMDRVSNLRCHVFIGTDVNPNGIDSTGRIGRTWTINFTLKGDVRLYKCRRIMNDTTIRKFYQYAESSEALIKEFVDYLNSRDGKFIKALIKKDGGINYGNN